MEYVRSATAAKSIEMYRSVRATFVLFVGPFGVFYPPIYLRPNHLLVQRFPK